MTMWRWAGVFALITVGLSLAFARIPDIDVCGAHGNPILAFELIDSPAEANALFPADCRVRELAAQRTALRLDNLAFIPAYGLFLILALLSQAGERSTRTRRAVRVFVAMVVIAMLADWWENSRLMLLADSYPGTQPLIDQLFPAVRLKFLLLGVAVTIIGVLHMRAGGWRRLAGGVIAVSAAWAAAAAVIVPHKLDYPTTIAWGVLALVSVVLAIKPPPPIAD